VPFSVLLLPFFFFRTLNPIISTDIPKFSVRASLTAQRTDNGWVVTYNVVKLPCGMLDVYQLLSHIGWREGYATTSVCNREVGVHVTRRLYDGGVISYEVYVELDFGDAYVDTRVKIVDAL